MGTAAEDKAPGQPGGAQDPVVVYPSTCGVEPEVWRVEPPKDEPKSLFARFINWAINGAGSRSSDDTDRVA